MTHSEEVIDAAYKEMAVLIGDKLAPAFQTLVIEYKISVAQNLRLEEGIHALCKRIDELPGA